ncbi:hypothetical protein RchiOBHm_Chr4g0400741 [Rosa chinensis]|uniref:Uncharacterized protein n=1 Tax=Rosa chinensis TaxID=74649 RepID=A0A2P6QSX2_ROSCH|nr:hypothetical protein RchiOBHm_Chr4g0400741 [Rosa chinensis]
MEEHINPLAVTHLLQHTLRSLLEGHGAYDRSRGNRRNWILVLEDGFCNFGAPHQLMIRSTHPLMSHEIYNCGEGLIGKVAADHSRNWIYKEPNDQHQEINFYQHGTTQLTWYYTFTI